MAQEFDMSWDQGGTVYVKDDVRREDNPEDFELYPKTCPVCGKEYTGRSAISRKDNETQICPECGIREALDAAFGLSDEEMDRIVKRTKEARNEED